MRVLVFVFFPFLRTTVGADEEMPPPPANDVVVVIVVVVLHHSRRLSLQCILRYFTDVAVAVPKQPFQGLRVLRALGGCLALAVAARQHQRVLGLRHCHIYPSSKIAGILRKVSERPRVLRVRPTILAYSLRATCLMTTCV